MKKILLACLLFFGIGSIAQEIQSEGIRVDTEPITKPSYSPEKSRSTLCGVDTVQYNMAKSTGAQAISINNSTSAYAFCQYFDCPQDITVHGADFVAYKSDSNGGDTIDCIVALYLASADSLPWGPPLATDTVPVDVNIWGLDLELLRKTAVFDVPVTMDAPYVVAVFNNSPNSIAMWGSDYQTGDGLGEHLGSARIGFNWVRGYNINVGGNPYDADMFIYPHVSYDLDAEFELDPNCQGGVVTVNTTNNSSPVMMNRFYSQEAFNNTGGNQFTWDWGDASPFDNGFQPNHTYGGGTNTVTLYDTLVGWDITCADHDSLSTCEPPIAMYSHADTICLEECLQLTNSSIRGDTYSWIFQNGTPGAWSAADPDSVCWSSPGTYSIQLTVTNSAGSDMMTTSVYVDPCGVGVDENEKYELAVYPNPANSQITLQAGGEMKGALLFDMSGKLILNENLNGNTKTSVDLTNLPIGIYAIRIEFEDGSFANRRIEIIR